MDAIKTFPKFSILFAIVMIVEILGLTVIPDYHIVSKPMIMASLIALYIMEEKRQNNMFMFGLICALLGDCFLLFETDDMFMIGLTCFLLMQLCYTSVFNKKRRIPRTRDYIVPGILAMFGITALAILWPSLGSMKLAVTLYTTAIVTMAIFAYLRHPMLWGHKILFAGVCLFIVSDALLGFNKFGDGFPYAQIAVMVTYMLAQYFIVTGELLGNRRKPQMKEHGDSHFARHKG